MTDRGKARTKFLRLGRSYTPLCLTLTLVLANSLSIDYFFFFDLEIVNKFIVYFNRCSFSRCVFIIQAAGEFHFHKRIIFR